MRNSFRLGSLFGVTINVHFSWLFIFTLVTLSLVDEFAGRFPQLPGGLQVGVGVVASLFFFASVLFHEMAHSLLAIHNRQPVRAITLFVFGGVSQIEKEAKQPGTEIQVALIGPISSFFLAAAFGMVWFLSRVSVPVIGSVAAWLATINLALGIFNLLPGLPLDGGRVLRGVIWSATGDRTRATRISGFVGIGLGYLIILIGIWFIFYGKNVGNGIWFILIGLFLANAARASMYQVEIERAVDGVRADQVMRSDLGYIPAGMSIAEFVGNSWLSTGGRCYLVGEPPVPRGIITHSDARAVPHGQWANTSVQAAMKPLAKVHSVEPDASLEEVIRLFDTQRISVVAVTSEGKLLGIIEREQLLRSIRNRMDLAA
ncbi:MAG: site-2 protease family protein [Blastocatellia bacterium]|nr:site-2 protease family protein [Blastocatellia bacterium]